MGGSTPYSRLNPYLWNNEPEERGSSYIPSLEDLSGLRQVMNKEQFTQPESGADSVPGRGDVQSLRADSSAGAEEAPPGGEYMMPGQGSGSTQPRRKSVAARIFAPHRITFLVFIVSGLIMLANTFRHPEVFMYDEWAHQRAVQQFQEKFFALPETIRYHHMQYNPALYYYLMGKLNYLVEAFADVRISWHYMPRIASLASILFIAYLYAFSLVPRMVKNKSAVQWFTFAFLLFPNVYLCQVMVRPDHLLFFSLHLLFYLWFRFDFHDKLARSGWRMVAWSILLMVMAHSRHFAIVGFAVFFAMGIFLLGRHVFISRSFRDGIFVLAVIAATIVVSSSHYASRYIGSGRLMGTSSMEIEEGAPAEKEETDKQPFDRGELFFNFQFDELYRRPNRMADFRGERGGNSFFPRLYGDLWADHWLHFSGAKLKETKVFEKRRVLLYGSVFTILWVIFPLLSTAGSCVALLRRKQIKAQHVAGWLSVGGVAILAALLYVHPYVGKQSTVKGAYIYAYYLFPFFPMLRLFDRFPKLGFLLHVYTIALYLLCVPLDLYRW